jgi:hypothetical protein
MRALRGELVRDAQLWRRRPGLPDELHSVNSSPIRDAFGAITAAVSVGRDVTQAHAAREALAQSAASAAVKPAAEVEAFNGALTA